MTGRPRITSRPRPVMQYGATQPAIIVVLPGRRWFWGAWRLRPASRTGRTAQARAPGDTQAARRQTLRLATWPGHTPRRRW